MFRKKVENLYFLMVAMERETVAGEITISIKLNL